MFVYSIEICVLTCSIFNHLQAIIWREDNQAVIYSSSEEYSIEGSEGGEGGEGGEGSEGSEGSEVVYQQNIPQIRFYVIHFSPKERSIRG